LNELKIEVIKSARSIFETPSAIKKERLKQTKIKYLIVTLGSLILCLNASATRPIWHGLIGGSYLFETHFNKNLHGFEVNLNRHYSGCVSSTYLNSFGVNYLYSKDYKEFGLSYSSKLFKNISGGKHGGWNLVYKINPNLVNNNSENIFMLKPGIGATIYTGARTSFVTLQVFAIYNYNIYFQKDQNINGMNNHSFQLGIFIGLNAFEMRPRKHRKSINKENEE